MDINVNIKAPELTAALLTLADALGVAGATRVPVTKEEAKRQPETKAVNASGTETEKPEAINPEESKSEAKDQETEKITIEQVRAKLAALPKEKARALITKYDKSESPKLSNIPAEKYAELLKEAEGS